jgi:hypothetical protein
MAKFWIIWTLAVFIIMVVGEGVPADYKVMFGFVCGTISGVMFIPRYAVVRVIHELKSKGITEDEKTKDPNPFGRS